MTNTADNYPPAGSTLVYRGHTLNVDGSTTDFEVTGKVVSMPQHAANTAQSFVAVERRGHEGESLTPLFVSRRNIVSVEDSPAADATVSH